MAPRCALVVLSALVPPARAEWVCGTTGHELKDGALCTAGAVDTCSDALCCGPTCDDHTCSDGFVPDAGKASTMCSAACDDAECCTKITKCADYTCLIAWQEKKASPPTDCDGSTCATTCCTDKAGTCYALKTSESCGAEKNEDADKYATEATSANYQSNCCKDKTCGNYGGSSCPADKKLDTTITEIATSANYQTKCCVDKTCGDYGGSSCPADKVVDTSITEIATSANYQTKCCVDKTCGDYGGSSCPADKKMDTSLTAIATSANYQTKCCVDKTCADYAGMSCPSGKFLDTSLTEIATSANYQTKCCTGNPTCDSYTCASTYKEKKAAADLPASCTGGTCTDSLCCKDKDICNNAGQSCSSSKFVDAMTAYTSSDSFASTCCLNKLKCADAVMNTATASGAPRVAPAAVAVLASASGAALAVALATAAAV